jgi:hypothetical protein
VLQRKRLEIAMFLSIASGKPFGRLLDSLRALLKEQRKAAKKCPKVIR